MVNSKLRISQIQKEGKEYIEGSYSGSVTQSSPALCDPMDCSTPGLPVHCQLQESTQTYVHQVGDAIQPSHPLSSPSPPAPSGAKRQKEPPLWTVGEGLYWAVALRQNSRGRVSKETKGVCEVGGVRKGFIARAGFPYKEESVGFSGV